MIFRIVCNNYNNNENETFKQYRSRVSNPGLLEAKLYTHLHLDHVGYQI